MSVRFGREFLVEDLPGNNNRMKFRMDEGWGTGCRSRKTPCSKRRGRDVGSPVTIVMGDIDATYSFISWGAPNVNRHSRLIPNEFQT